MIRKFLPWFLICALFTGIVLYVSIRHLLGYVP